MKRFIAVIVLASLALTGCATSRTHAPEGAAIGGAAGVALGTIASRGDGLFAPLAFGLFGAALGASIGDQYRKVPAEYEYAGAPPSAVVAGSSDIVVNIPNANGTTTAVVLKRSGSGFIGPQGEYYPSFPPMAQLTAMYGKG